MEVTNLTRRGLLGAFLAAPAIVRASSLMAMPRAPLLFDPNSITAGQIAVGTINASAISCDNIIQYAFDYKRKLVWHRTSKSQWNGDPDKGIGGEPMGRHQGFLFPEGVTWEGKPQVGVKLLRSNFSMELKR